MLLHLDRRTGTNLYTERNSMQGPTELLGSCELRIEVLGLRARVLKHNYV